MRAFNLVGTNKQKLDFMYSCGPRGLRGRTLVILSWLWPACRSPLVHAEADFEWVHRVAVSKFPIRRCRIASDGAGGSFVVGAFSGTLSLGAATLTSSPTAVGLFLIHLNRTGGVEWATKVADCSSLPDNNGDGQGIANDGAGGVYIVGTFKGSFYFGNTSLMSSGGTDAFVLRASNTGAVLWAIRTGGSWDDRGVGVAAGDNGSALVTGCFRGVNVSFGSTLLTSTGDADSFVLRLTSTGWMSWATPVYASSGRKVCSTAIASDGAGGALVTGSVGGAIEVGDVFVLRISSKGAFEWTFLLGAAMYRYSSGIVSDGSDGALVTGLFADRARFGSTQLSSGGSVDAFVVKVSSTGVRWAIQAGGRSRTRGIDAAQDGAGGALIAGCFARGSPGQFGSTTFSATSGGDRDVDLFIMRVSQYGTIDWTTWAGGVSDDRAHGIMFDGMGGAVVAGAIDGDATFGSKRSISDSRSGVHGDLVVARLDLLALPPPPPPLQPLSLQMSPASPSSSPARLWTATAPPHAPPFTPNASLNESTNLQNPAAAASLWVGLGCLAVCALMMSLQW